MKHWIVYRIDELPYVEHDPRYRNYATRIFDLLDYMQCDFHKDYYGDFNGYRRNLYAAR